MGTICENINKNILLTGAGFSKDFGGLLASEISNKLFNSPKATALIKNKILELNNSNYEAVYESIGDNEKQIFGNLLVDVFRNFDERINSKLRSLPPNFKKFIKLFDAPNFYNFIFTLNQDLLLERTFLLLGLDKQATYTSNSNDKIKKDLDKIINLHFPNTNYSLSTVIKCKDNSNGYIQRIDSYDFNDFIQVIKYEGDITPKIGFNYIKIHGSMNWEHSEGNNITITGGAKELSVNQYNVLKYNFELSKKIFNCSNLKIVIVGYGFADKHVNDLLLSAVNQGSKLIIINPMEFDSFKKLKITFTDDNNAINKKFLNDILYYPRTLVSFLENEDEFISLENELELRAS